MKAIPLVLLLLALASSADAQSPPQQPPQRIPVYLSLMGEPFRGPVGGPRPLADWFAVADRNHDGAVSLAEMLEDASRFFKTLDVDGNGVINTIEMSRYETQIAPAQVRFDGGLKPFRSSDKSDSVGRASSDDPDRRERRSFSSIGGGSGRMLRDLQYLEVPQPVMMADSDVNQRVTTDEFAKMAAKRFALNDENGDGRLESSELTPPLDNKGRPIGPGQRW
ncbi:MAG TPA: EF-hand domain-containing protein [Sphingomicrobium sp.]|nr:EF-hand domain-containing protein [Sphingomicrobium sp.]